MKRWWPVWHVAVILWMMAVSAVFLFSGCSMGAATGEPSEIVGGAVPSCVVVSVRYPVSGEATFNRHGGRRFLVDNVHLGTDILLPEGRAIHPIACGVVKLARAANGYGALVVVVEHTLDQPVEFTNGLGQRVSTDRFLSIYGHLRLTAERQGRGARAPITVGAVVDTDTVIGYVEQDALNGDGIEHLHLGIRLQSAERAQASDPTAWFRGYDGSPSQRRWFADPEQAFARLSEAFSGPTSPGPSVMVDAGSTVVDVVHSPPRVEDVPPVAMDRPTAPLDRGAPRVEQDVVSVPPPMDVVLVTDRPAVSLPDRVSIDAPTPVDQPAATPNRGLIRYEFRARIVHRHQAPYHLRTRWWEVLRCVNTGTELMETVGEWQRCDAPRTDPFDASFFLPDHLDWGDRGHLGTIANTPTRCWPQPGIDWRLTDLDTGRVLYEGPVSGLPCVAVGSQDRLAIP